MNKQFLQNKTVIENYGYPGFTFRQLRTDNISSLTKMGIECLMVYLSAFLLKTAQYNSP